MRRNLERGTFIILGAALAACGAASDPVARGGSGHSGGRLAAPGSGPHPPQAGTQSNAGDRYMAPGTNPFVMVAHDPLSTFAADVDTASYDILVRDVSDGLLPQAESVRLEEYLNYFSYAYPAPADATQHPFQISLAAAPHILDRDTTLLRVGVQGVEPPPFEKKPANLVFLVDVSGSMQGPEKLPLVQRVLRQTLERLNPGDTVSIVTYASGTGVAVSPTRVSEVRALNAAIDGLRAGGSTNGAGGIQLAYELAQVAFIEGGINHVLLCTDGDFNVGVSSPKALVELIKQKRKTGVTLTVLGFGRGNLNDHMMEAISNAGNGIYGVIPSAEHADRYVAEKMLSALEHIAQDVKLQVEFNPTLVSAYRLLGYENRAIADPGFRNDTIDAGELGAGHRVTALYELVLAGGQVPEVNGAPPPTDGPPSRLPAEVEPGELVAVKLRYKHPGSTSTTPAIEMREALADDTVSPTLAAADQDLRWAAAVAAFAEVLKRSPHANVTHLAEIESIVTAQSARDRDRREFAELFQRATTLLAAR